MRRGIIALAAVGLLAVSGLTACGKDDNKSGSSGGKKAKIGVILPDSKSSARWETADRKYLEKAFKDAGVDYTIQNAQNDKNAFQTIADTMISSGVTVLMIVNLDSGTGKAVLDKAKKQGIATIDYDRLTLGGSASYYVSFDGVAVGKKQGEGLVKCLTAAGKTKANIIELNGSPTDNNATLFKQGYDSVLNPKYQSGEYTKVDDQAVPDWDNAQAATIFQQSFTKVGGKVDGVLAANDGLGNAALQVLKTQGLGGKVPITGQDATVQGLQNILDGNMCMTVYKAIQKEAKAASDLAVALAKNERKDTGQKVKDPEGNREVPSVLLDPQAIFKENVKDVVADGFVTKAELCTGAYEAKCTAAGIS